MATSTCTNGRRLKGGVDLLPSSSTEAPYCLHGPTSVFERFFSKGDKQPQKFYACAVYRSRKLCNFYHPLNDTISDEKRARYHKAYNDRQLELQSQCTEGIVKELIARRIEDRYICETCGVMLVNTELILKHNNHKIKRGLINDDLNSPTILLRPQDDNTGQAQYFFSESSRKLFLSEIDRLKKTHVICLGVPRLHEDLISVGNVKSFLLDIDHRYVQFYEEDSFQRFNMFNGFFYCERGAHHLNEFLKSSVPGNVLLVVDPPFGGLLTALKTGIDVIWNIMHTELSTLLVFPYFNERHVIESFPSFNMLDYQVTYECHRHFNEKKSNKKPSPVRLFTNISPPGLKLPLDEGYRFCAACNRYVHDNNSHCEKCDKCTSKDGRQYIHCDKCSVCVKQSYIHCDVCNMCLLPDHNCDNDISCELKRQGCHICGSIGHKRRECPLKSAADKETSISKRHGITSRRRDITNKGSNDCNISRKKRKI